MDVLSLEHNFGKEIETSLHQLFIYFCNNINLGQWQAAKACLQQLYANKKNFKLDIETILADLIETPELYNEGSCTLASPHHLSLLLYEFCVDNQFMEKHGDYFYDRIVFKFIIYSALVSDKSLSTSGVFNQSKAKLIVDDLVQLVKSTEMFKYETKLLQQPPRLNKSSTSSSLASSIAESTPQVTGVETPIDLREETILFMKNMFITSPHRAKSFVELVLKYNYLNSQTVFLEIHLGVIMQLVEELELHGVKVRRRSTIGNHPDTLVTPQFTSLDQIKTLMLTLLNSLSIYKLRLNPDSESSAFHSAELLRKCFRSICFKLNKLWSDNFELMDEMMCKVYASLMFEYNEIDEANDKNNNDTNTLNMMTFFSRVHYEVERELSFSRTNSDEEESPFPLLSLIKLYANMPDKESHLWRRFFLYCQVENKILLKSVIEECMELINRGQFDNLALMFSIKEFVNLRPLILLLGISKVNDIQSAKKLITSLCPTTGSSASSGDRGTPLCNKLGNLLKTHLDFMTWFQQIKGEHKRKEISFNDLIKLLHKQLPLNIISQYVDMTALDHAEMTKMLKNTLTDKDTSGQKTKWVRFVDEVNEKVSLIQQSCLAIYNGFYGLNETLNTILYCCEHLNSRIYATTQSSSSLSPKDKLKQETKKDKSATEIATADSEEQLQSDYKQNVVDKLNNVKQILGETLPLNFRLEILENIYSLLYLSSNDLKDDEEEDEEDELDDEGIAEQHIVPENDEKKIEVEHDGYEIINEYDPNGNRWRSLSQQNSKDEGAAAEVSIYETDNKETTKALSSKGSICSFASGNNSSESMRHYYSNSKLNVYRRNAGGGGSFLVNDFLCRDILFILKELLSSYKNGAASTQSFFDYDPNSLNCSISRQSELDSRAQKLMKLVSETIWRFQLVRSDFVRLEYGQVGILRAIANSNSDKTASVESNTSGEREQAIVYELMKKRRRNSFIVSNNPNFRKRNESSASLHSSYNEASAKLAFSKSSNFGSKSRTNTLNVPSSGGGAALTLSPGLILHHASSSQFLSPRPSNTATGSVSRFRSGTYMATAESQRSLSVILNSSHGRSSKRSNSIITKLLANVNTLASMCLKEGKYDQAKQLLKMYESSSSSSFECGQIAFHSIYENAINELAKFTKKSNNNELVEMSRQSWDLARVTEPLLQFDAPNDFIHSVFLADLLAVFKFDSSLCSNLIDYGRIKLNQDLVKSTSVKPESRNSSDNRLPSGSPVDLSSEIAKFEYDMKTKLSQFLEAAQFISTSIQDNPDAFVGGMTVNDSLFDFDGVRFGLNSRNQINQEDIQILVDRFCQFIRLKKSLNDLKTEFEYKHEDESEAGDKHETFLKLMKLVNESIKLDENENLISTFYYKPPSLMPPSGDDKQPLFLLHDSYEVFLNSVERSIATTASQSQSGKIGDASLNSSMSVMLPKSSNYLLSFYEYCKTLSEYLKEKSSTLNKAGSFFTILDSSPASLICKLIFEDSIKPQLIESLTQKLNLNLTAIILHNSCPRLKLTLNPQAKAAISAVATLQSSASPVVAIAKSSMPPQFTRSMSRASPGDPSPKSDLTSALIQPAETVNLYNLNSFYRVLNQSDIINCCSRKKPHEFVRDLLLKLLKYCKNFNQHQVYSNATKIDLSTAKEIYQCAEFKTILNESQELQHLNMLSLKTDHQKLSFFINLYNLLSIHAHFYLAAQNTTHKSYFEELHEKLLVLNEISIDEDDPTKQTEHYASYLFHSSTERLLFEQRMCYKVGQMGHISLYDLKHLILLRQCMNNDDFTSLNFATIDGRPIERGTLPQPLYKYAFYTLDLDAEPLWTAFLPSEHLCDYRVLFALTNCAESDPPLCVFDFDERLLDEQLTMQARLFLNDSIFANLIDDALYLPNFVVQNCSFFIEMVNSHSGEQNPHLHHSVLYSKLLLPFKTTGIDSTKNDLDTLVRFLMDLVNDEVRENLKRLLDLDSIHEFGENIDQYGRKELPFTIEKLPESSKFSLVFDYNYPNQALITPYSNQSTVILWYRRTIAQIMQASEFRRKRGGTINNDTLVESTNHTNEASVDATADTTALAVDEDVIKSGGHDNKSKSSRQQLNKDCMEYIEKNSPLIANSLSFLFDESNRNEFFQLISNTESMLELNSGTTASTGATKSAETVSNDLKNSLSRFIQLYVPLDYMKHLSIQVKLNLITQFLLTNRTDESKIELIIDLANHYACKQEWNLVIELLNNCTQDNEELLNEFNYHAVCSNGTDLIQESLIDESPLVDNNVLPSSVNIGESIEDQEPQVIGNASFINHHQHQQAHAGDNTSNNNNPSSRRSQRDLQNLYDHACVCLAFQEARHNDKSYMHLFKMKNFLRQIRAIFGLMYLWPIDSCLELIDFCLTKSKLFEQPFVNSLSSSLNIDSETEQRDTKQPFQTQYIDYHKKLVAMLNDKKTEFTAYKELTRCARSTLEKYYEHQQIQDAAGFYDNENSNLSFSSTNVIDKAFNMSEMNKMKKVCQKCLTWQYAKSQLESASEDSETNELIMDLFLLNDQFTSAKYLIRKLNLGEKLQFKLDFGHLKHRLLNLNVSSSIIVVDLDSILKECISFEPNQTSSSSFEGSNNRYVFDICYKLLLEFKDLNELNNQVLVSMCEFLIKNYRQLLTDSQLKELRILQTTAKIFQSLVQEEAIEFDSYKRHHSDPLLIIEQLLMNTHTDLCSKTIKICRESLNDQGLNVKINQLLLKYARKALEFRLYPTRSQSHSQQQSETTSLDQNSGHKNRSPVQLQHQISTTSALPTSISSSSRFNKTRRSVDVTMISSSMANISLSSSPGASTSSNYLSTSFKQPYGRASMVTGMPIVTSTPPSGNTTLTSSSYVNPNTSFNSNSGSHTFNTTTTFVMPLVPPKKEDWVKDEEVDDCMVCNTTKFNLLNRRHHCRRCGRVVCANCSQRTSLIDKIPRRTCDDCFKQLERREQQVLQQQLLINSNLNDNGNDLLVTGFRRVKKNNLANRLVNKSQNTALTSLISMEGVSSGSNPTGSSPNPDTGLDEEPYWQFYGGKDEVSQKRDEEVRQSFRFHQAPSTSLCLSILDLHDNSLECGKHLLTMCDDLSSYLQSTASSQAETEDFGLIINMIKNLLNNAKMRLLQNSSTNIISLCDTYLSLIDVLEQLLLANCSLVPSLNELRNTESVRRIRNRLLEEERHELAMNLSTKCGLDTQTVWASWGMIELRRGNYKEARNKFEKCMRPVSDKQASISSQAQVKILSDIINYFENAPSVLMMGPQALLNPLRSVESLLAEPKFFSIGDMNLDEYQLRECIYYIETYGNHAHMVSFFQSHNQIENAFQYLIDKKCNVDIFVEFLLVPSLRSGEFHSLLEYMLSIERGQSKLHPFYTSIAKYLEKSGYVNTLYEFQIIMKDYVRASITCQFFFTRQSTSYADLYKNLHFLNKAREHLEHYMELPATKQLSQMSQQQQNYAWKSKNDNSSLNKQITTQEVDNCLKAISLQIEVTKFINNCIQQNSDKFAKLVPTRRAPPTLLSSTNDDKISLCSLILLSGQSVQEGFGFVIRIIQCFNLNTMLVFPEIARELAKQLNVKEIHSLLTCLNESGYRDIGEVYDECVGACVRVFNSLPNSSQYSKEIEDLTQLIKDDVTRINSYVGSGRLKSAYLIAIRIDRPDLVKHIANVAERINQLLIRDICNKWLDRRGSSVATSSSTTTSN